MTITEIERDLAMFDRNEERSSLSIDFKAIVNALSKIYADVEAQPDREYVYGEEAVISFSARTDDTKQSDASMSVSIWISFLSPYAAIVWKKNLGSNETIVVAPPDLSRFHIASDQKIRAILEQEGCVVVPNELLYEYLPGRTGQMDESTPTVFGALFSELG